MPRDDSVSEGTKLDFEEYSSAVAKAFIQAFDPGCPDDEESPRFHRACAAFMHVGMAEAPRNPGLSNVRYEYESDPTKTKASAASRGRSMGRLARLGALGGGCLKPAMLIFAFFVGVVIMTAAFG